MFQAVHWAAKRGLREEESFSSDTKKQEARRTGIRGETYAYWYLRRNGYVFVARNYTPRGIKGGLDLVGYHGNTLPFVEVRTRTVQEESPALPELRDSHGAAISCRALPAGKSLLVRRRGD